MLAVIVRDIPIPKPGPTIVRAVVYQKDFVPQVAKIFKLVHAVKASTNNEHIQVLVPDSGCCLPGRSTTLTV